MLIRKKRGNFLEDFRVGQLFRHKVGKTVTEGLFNAFTEFGMTTGRGVGEKEIFYLERELAVKRRGHYV